MESEILQRQRVVRERTDRGNASPKGRWEVQKSYEGSYLAKETEITG